MSTPPRRRRPESRRSKPKGGGGWLPTIGMGIAVILAGLGIGALIAVLMQRTAPKDQVAVVTSAPSVQPSTGRVPVVIATIEPPRTPRPSPSPLPSPVSSPSSSAAPSSLPSPSPSPVAMPSPSSRPTTVAPTQNSSPQATPVALSTAASTAGPSPVQSVLQAGVASPAAANDSASSGDAASANSTPAAASSYEQHASGVVRGYLDALIRGDQKAAYRALGESAGSGLTEQSFIDASARIVSLKVTRIDASNASVGCEIAAAKGHYYATYHVTAGSSGPYISEHDYIKV